MRTGKFYKLVPLIIVLALRCNNNGACVKVTEPEFKTDSLKFTQIYISKDGTNFPDFPRIDSTPVVFFVKDNN
jgi:hypothetical protein